MFVMGPRTARKLFGTDGVRGRANQEPMTVETAMALGKAAGCILRKGKHKPKVIIGKDTRLSGYMFESALIAGFCSVGVDTFQVGPLPTPAVAFITRAYRADAGVVVSASHNPFQDNGIKFFSAAGHKLSDAIEEEIETLVAGYLKSDCLPKSEHLGVNRKLKDAGGRYVEFVKTTFNRKLDLKGMKIVLDCANGAAYQVAPAVFSELGGTVFEIGAKPNGLNINLDCGSMHPEKLQKAVLSRQGNIGIALDGDADRVVLVDEGGRIVDGDAILAICARDMKHHGLLEHNTLVSTVMANLGFIKAMDKLGIKVMQSQVGDRYVIQQMLENGLNLGGEQSGHLIFMDYNTTGDGIVAALQVLRIMKETGLCLSELACVYEKLPQSVVSVQVSKKPPLNSLTETQKVIREVQAQLKESGRVLVRYSGTEPLCRIMVEGPEQAKVDEYTTKIANAIKLEI